MAFLIYRDHDKLALHHLDPLRPTGFRLEAGSIRLVPPEDSQLMIVPQPQGLGVRYHLLGWPKGVKVNGQAFLSVCALQDKDQILLPPGLVGVFRELTLVRVVAALPAGAPAACGLCGAPLSAPAVRCPGCGTWFHQQAEVLPCWASRDTCGACGQPTRLDDDEFWSTLHLELEEIYGGGIEIGLPELVQCARG